MRVKTIFAVRASDIVAQINVIMPGIGICDWLWGAKLLDENGDLRSDLEFPIRRLCSA